MVKHTNQSPTQPCALIRHSHYSQCIVGIQIFRSHIFRETSKMASPKAPSNFSLDWILCRVLCACHSGTRNPLNPSRVAVEISLPHQHLSWWLDSMCVPPNSLWTMACTLRQKQKPWRAARQQFYRIFIFIF